MTTAVFWTEKEVSQVTQLKLPTLRNHRHLNKGIPYIKCGGAVRYIPEDVFNYMNARRIDPEAAR